MQAVLVLALFGCAAALPLQQVEYPASPLVTGNKPQFLVRYSAEDTDDDDVGYFRSAVAANTGAVAGNVGAVVGNAVVVPDSLEDVVEDQYFRSAVAGNVGDVVVVPEVDSVEDDLEDQYFRSAVGATVPHETVVDVSQVDFANFRSAGHQDSIVVPSNSGEEVDRYVLVGVAPSNSITLGSRAANVYPAGSYGAPIPIYREVDDDDTSLENNIPLPTLYDAMRSSTAQQMQVKAEPTLVGNNMVLLLD